MSKIMADVRWLTFRLKNGQSIGPERLKDGWVIASETARCEVRREHIEDRAWCMPCMRRPTWPHRGARKCACANS